jgi:hypothetical protein
MKYWFINMSAIFRSASENSKLYNIDEFGVKNYNRGFIALICFASLFLSVLIFGTITYYSEYGIDGSTIKSPEDAYWLMMMASSTIGFGDHYPVTLLGRLMVILMFIFGVGIIGGLGALIASKLLGFSDTSIKNRVISFQNLQTLELVLTLSGQITELEKAIAELKENKSDQKPEE